VYVTIDQKLSWLIQTDYHKGLNDVAGKTWDCNPSILRWMYTNLITPLLRMGLISTIRPDKVLLGIPLAKYKDSHAYA